MDNLTHSLVGLAAAKAGLGRLSPYATFVCVAAANLPDIDIVGRAGGPAFYLQHHRGITHSIVGILAQAVAFPLLFHAAERVWARARGRDPRARLKGLLVCSLLLMASHPLLDWTNSYGVRPFLPWDGRWIYGDLLFVIDPWVWLVLGGACFLLAGSRLRAAGWGLLGLVVTLVLSYVVLSGNAGPLRRVTIPPAALAVWGAGLAAFGLLRWRGFGGRHGRVVAASALAFVLCYCCALAFVQTAARRRAESASRRLVLRDGDRLLRVAATPVLADPLTWRCLAETEDLTGRFNIRLWGAPPGELAGLVRFGRPAGEEAEAARRASEGYDARVLLDFARFPVASVRREDAGGWVVQFADLRFTEPGEGARPGGFALDVPLKR